MARSIMDVMQENVNPVSVSNALYELMVDWRNMVLTADQAPNPSQEKKLRSKRKWLETALGRFFGCNDAEMRELLEDHFDIKVSTRKWN